MFGALVQTRAFAEAGDVRVRVFVALPCMKGTDDFHAVFVGEVPDDSVRHAAQSADSYEMRFAHSVANVVSFRTSFGFRGVFRCNPKFLVGIREELLAIRL